MRTPKPKKSAVARALAGAGIALLAVSGLAQAQVVASDQPAGLVVFPKVLVDLTGRFSGGRSVDTVIQLTNTDTALTSPNRSLHCFWVNARGYCNGDPLSPCDANSDESGLNCRSTGRRCVPSWSFTNFVTDLTPGQTVGFRASEGMMTLPCESGPCYGARTNAGASAIIPVPNLFIGELKCVQVDSIATEVPVTDRNDINGVARIYSVSSGASGETVDVRSYNAIGIQTTGTPNSDTNLCLGTEGTECQAAEYAACPGTLILEHFFEQAEPFIGTGDSVRTMLTLVPCTENLNDPNQGQVATVAQFATYNEFEQRFSSTRRIDCFDSVRLADIDTHVGSGDDGTSLFAVGVQGTLTGQTRIRGVPTNQAFHGLLGVAEEFFTNGSDTFSDAINLHLDRSTRPDGVGDVLRLPPFP